MFLEFFQEKRKNCGRKGSYTKYGKKVHDIWTIRGHPLSLLYKKVNELEFIQILVNRKYELSEKKKRIGINVFFNEQRLLFISKWHSANNLQLFGGNEITNISF